MNLRRPRAILYCAAAFGLALTAACDAFGGNPDEVIEGAEVRKGSLSITVVERGNLKAADVVSLKSEIEGSSTILYLIDEGVHVEAGTLLCELDATGLVDKKVSQEISVRNAQALTVEARQSLEIQKSQNESDVAKAKQDLDFAHQDLKKYRDGDMLVKDQAAREEITLKTEESARAKEQFEWSQKLAEKGFLTNTELEADRLAETRSKILYEQAERELKLLIDYEFPREIQKLEAALREAERELDRVNLQAEARLVDRTSALETNEAKLELEQEKLSKLVRQIAKAKLIAPKAGMVVYAKQEEGGRFGNSQPIAEGTSVRERQEIITIPNAGDMIAQASLHESVLKQVEVGMPVDVNVDAIPGQIFKGRVKMVAVLPDQNSWWANPNLRLYRCDVEVAGGTAEMRPGMSCSITIFCDEIADATYVPVTAVFRHKGESVCFVSKGSKYEVVPVKPGRLNDKWVEILGGVTVGQRVLLSVPSDFKLEAPKSDESAPGAGPDAAAPTPTGAAPRAMPAADASSDGASSDGASRRGGGSPRGGDASRGEWNGAPRGEGAADGERPSGGRRSPRSREGGEAQGTAQEGSAPRERDSEQGGGQGAGETGGKEK
ncbi:MAG: efflux RND transporter periplasmic adaptor subunit [Planctomycetes bacterium]|nr:efflux RND transporter periplasmic adaptor subunit [Planctomycetota bacterium]